MQIIQTRFLVFKNMLCLKFCLFQPDFLNFVFDLTNILDKYLAYLFENEYEKAQKIYLELKDKRYEDGRLYKDIFIDDVHTLEEMGIKNEHFDHVKKMLQNGN